MLEEVGLNLIEAGPEMRLAAEQNFYSATPFANVVEAIVAESQEPISNYLNGRDLQHPALSDTTQAAEVNLLRLLVSRVAIGAVTLRESALDERNTLVLQAFTDPKMIEESQANLIWYRIRSQLNILSLMPDRLSKPLTSSVIARLGNAEPDWFEYVYSLIGVKKGQHYLLDGRRSFTSRNHNNHPNTFPTLAGWRLLRNDYMLHLAEEGPTSRTVQALSKHLPGLAQACDYHVRTGNFPRT